MADSDAATPPSNGNGSRPVTNSDLQKELRILTLEISGRLDLMMLKQDSADDAYKAMKTMVEKNAHDILMLRESVHATGNTVQKHVGLHAIMSDDCGRRLVQLLPFIEESKSMLERAGMTEALTPKQREWVVEGERELASSNLRTLAESQRKATQHQARWNVMPREILVGLVAIPVLLTVNNAANIWHALFH